MNCIILIQVLFFFESFTFCSFQFSFSCFYLLIFFLKKIKNLDFAVVNPSLFHKFVPSFEANLRTQDIADPTFYLSRVSLSGDSSPKKRQNDAPCYSPSKKRNMSFSN